MRQIKLEEVNFNNIFKHYTDRKKVISNIRTDLHKIIQVSDAKAGLFTLYNIFEHKFLPELFIDQNNNLIQHSYNAISEPFFPFERCTTIKDFTNISTIFKTFIDLYEANIIFYFPIIIKQIKHEIKIGEIVLFLNNDSIPAEKEEALKLHLNNFFLTVRTYYYHARMVRKTRQLTTLVDFSKYIETIAKKEDILKAIEQIGLEGFKKIYHSTPGFLIRLIEGNKLVAYELKKELSFIPKSISINEPLFKEVLDTKQSMVIDNPKSNPDFRRLMELYKENKEYNQFQTSLSAMIITPFLLNNTPRGVFIIYKKDGAVGTSEKLFFDDLAVITSLAYKNLESYEKAEKREEEKIKRLKLLHELTRDIISEPDIKKLLEAILTSGLRLVRARSGNIRIFDREQNILKKVVSSKDPLDVGIPIMKTMQGICGKVVKTGIAVNETDTYQLDYWRELLIEHMGKEVVKQLIKEGKLMRSEISAPLKVGNEIIGTIDAHKLEVGGFTNEDLEIFKDLAILSAIVLKRQELQDRLNMVRGIANSYSDISNIDLSKILSDFLRMSLKVISVSKGAIALVETVEGKEKLKFLTVENIAGLKKDDFREIGEGIMGKAAKELIEMKVDDVTEYFGHIIVDPMIKSECVAPLIFDGKLKGNLMVASSVSKRFSEDDKELLKIIANHIAILIHNIQLIKEKEEHYRRMQTETIQNMVNLSGMMAHQINNPLGSIQVNISVLKDKIKAGNNDIQDNINTIMRGIGSASQVIKKIKAFTHKAGTEMREYNIHKVIDETVDFIKGIRLREKNITVATDYNENIFTLRFDRFQMIQVFLNLINNAYDAMRGKGGCLCISTKKVNHTVEICFDDKGIGIPEANRNNIFRSFYTTKKGRGTGLGLAISKRLVENHGGRISFESEEGVGTKFIIRLPFEGKELKDGIPKTNPRAGDR